MPVSRQRHDNFDCQTGLWGNQPPIRLYPERFSQTSAAGAWSCTRNLHCAEDKNTPEFISTLLHVLLNCMVFMHRFAFWVTWFANLQLILVNFFFVRYFIRRYLFSVFRIFGKYCTANAQKYCYNFLSFQNWDIPYSGRREVLQVQFFSKLSLKCTATL
jgi:hypothetical protein